MFYVEDLTVETTHTAGNPLEKRIKCWSGAIHHVGLFTRRGVGDTIKVAFFRGGHQIYPATSGKYFTPSSHPLRFKDFLVLQPGENEIVIKLWNVNATYPHTVTVELGILPEEEISTSKALILLAEAINYFGDKVRTYF